jgi:hypothetical protein
MSIRLTIESEGILAQLPSRGKSGYWNLGTEFILNPGSKVVFISVTNKGQEGVKNAYPAWAGIWPLKEGGYFNGRQLKVGDELILENKGKKIRAEGIVEPPR